MEGLRYMKLNKRGDYDYGRKVLYIFVALVFLTMFFVAFIGVLNNAKSSSFKTKDAFEGSVIKYLLLHSTNCFASEELSNAIDIKKFTNENLVKCTKFIDKPIKAALFEGDKITGDWISNDVGGYKKYSDSLLVNVKIGDEVKLMRMEMEYGY